MGRENRTPMTMAQIKERNAAWAKAVEDRKKAAEAAETAPLDSSKEDKRAPEGAREEVGDKNINILQKKIESGEDLDLPGFDNTSTKLLEKIMDVPQKAGIVERIVKTSATYVAEKLAPVTAGIVGAKILKEIFHDKVRDWTSKYMMGFLPDIIANKGAGIIKNIGEASSVINTDLTTRGLEKGWNVFKEYIVKPSVQLAQEAHAKGVHLAQEVGAKAAEKIGAGVEQVIHGAAETTGTLVGTPIGAIAGWTMGSGLMGGAIGVLKEYYQSSGFAPLSKMIEEAKERVSSKDAPKEGVDPRHTLIAMEKKILEDNDMLGFKNVNKEEWIQFISQTRAAKISLLKEKTAYQAEIFSDPKILEREKGLVESTIQGLRGATEADQQSIAKILTQFDRSLDKDLGPAEKQATSYNSLYKKVLRYSGAFASGAFNSTGIPMMWKISKFIGRTTVRGAAAVASGGTSEIIRKV